MNRLILAASAAFFVSAAQAQECMTVEEVAVQIQNNGGEILTIMDVNGVGYDQVVLLDNGNEVLVFGMVREGCLVGRPLPVGPLAEVTPA